MALNSRTLLGRTSLFRGLPQPTIEQISALALRRKYEHGAIIFSQGDAGDAIYGVVTGRVLISAGSAGGKQIFLNLLESGETFGEIALLDGQARTATASAAAPTELMIIMREPFLSLLQAQPVILGHLLQILCQRIRWTSGLAEEWALLSVPARLARRLLSLGHMHGRASAAGVQLVISQQEVAQFLGLSRQVINQHLQDWKSKGWVALTRGKITILDPVALRAADRD